MKILVTGGASGLGKAITERLVRDGHQLLVTYYHSKDAAMELERTLGIQSIQCNFSSPESVANLLTTIEGIELEGLVNNALTNLKKQHFHKIDPTDFLTGFRENVLSTLVLTQALIKKFKKQKFGRIVTILSSSLINTPPIGWSEYTANKAYLLSMSKSWAVENAKSNITSNCISPAFMMTSLNQDVDERIIENMTKAHPLKKLLHVDEVADAVAFLINASPQINGTNMVINAAESI